jgi:penicillin-binding protein 2
MGSTTIAVQGEDINLTLDAELQRYGEQLMINKRGGIVAIEPKQERFWL